MNKIAIIGDYNNDYRPSQLAPESIREPQDLPVFNMPLILRL